MKSKFEFYEIVVVVSTSATLKDIHGMKGTVLGRARHANKWTYTIQFFDFAECWVVEESELRSTGEFSKKEQIYSEETLTVSVDPKTGSGNIN